MRSYGVTNLAPYAAAPAVGSAGDAYYNTSDKVLYLSDGTVWNSAGGTPASLDTPWRYLGYAGEPAYQNGAGAYAPNGTVWSGGRFKRDAAGCVWLDGLVAGLTNGAAPTVLFTLPVGFRPAVVTRYFTVTQQGNVFGSIRIAPSGDVTFYPAASTNPAWCSLHGVTFMGEDALTVSWVRPALSGGWTNMVSPVGYFIDNAGDIHLCGQATGGTIGSGTPIFTFPGGVVGDVQSSYPASALSGAARVDVDTTGRVYVANWIGGGGTWVSLDGIVVANPNGVWNEPSAMLNGWSNYGAPYPNLAFCKNRNGVAAVRGLIKGGVTTSNTSILLGGSIPHTTKYEQLLANIAASSGGGRIDVMQDGALNFVSFLNSGTNGYVGAYGRWTEEIPAPSIGSFGWYNFASSVTGVSKYQVIDGVMYVWVDGTFSTTSGTVYTLSTAPLPVGYRPSANARAGGYFGGFPGSLWVDATGAVACLQNSGAARTSVSGIVVYPL